ncbi:MAG: cysteine desulfurase [Lentisphaerae bacterium]|nr:cysteine desulfurase [Lentisphaerota bacterium]
MPIYLDHNATTPVAPEVLAAMAPFFSERFGNPASLHRTGSGRRRDLDAARAHVARLIGADATEIVFTSGGTESNNLALRGAWQARGQPLQLITSRVEHPAVRQVCRQLRAEGADLTEIGVDRAGRLDLEALRAALARGPALVSLMWANNETGVLFPMPEIAPMVKAAGGLLHTDAVQAAGRIPIRVRDVAVDLLSISGHKLHGPKGIGALYVRRGVKLHPQLLGGTQEQGLRAGTSNVPGIVGLGQASEWAARRLPEMARVRALRDRLEAGLRAHCPGMVVHGAGDPRLPNTLNVRFPRIEGESLLFRLDDAGIAISTGAACSSGKMEPSHVILAMGITGRDAGGAVRFSLGLDNTEADIEATITETAAAVQAMRG